MAGPNPKVSGPPVFLRAGNYFARSARVSDASTELASWFRDTDRVAPLNMPARDLSVPELRRFIETFDNRRAGLILLFAEKDKVPCGLFHSEVNRTHRVARVAYMSGGATATHRRAFPQLAPKLLQIQFQRYGVEKVIAHVSCANALIARHLERIGFKREGTLRSQVRAPNSDVRLDQWIYGLLPEELTEAVRTRPRAVDGR